MSRPELHETLAALLDGLAAPANGGLGVDAAEITAPMEVMIAATSEGLVAFAAPPATRLATGFAEPLHRVRIAARTVAPAPAVPEGDA